MDTPGAPCEEKFQPWKSAWLERQQRNANAPSAKNGMMTMMMRHRTEGTSHGFAKGQLVIMDGTSVGMGRSGIKKKEQKEGEEKEGEEEGGDGHRD